MQNPGHVDDVTLISALDVSYEMDGRMIRCILEVSDWYREEDAGDLRRIGLND